MQLYAWSGRQRLPAPFFVDGRHRRLEIGLLRFRFQIALNYYKLYWIHTEMSELGLDDVKEFIFVAQRSQERFSTNLQALGSSLDKIKDGEDEWLLQVLEEAEKGQAFCATQLSLWETFYARVEAYVLSVRKQADEMAIQGW